MEKGVFQSLRYWMSCFVLAMSDNMKKQASLLSHLVAMHSLLKGAQDIWSAYHRLLHCAGSGSRRLTTHRRLLNPIIMKYLFYDAYPSLPERIVK